MYPSASTADAFNRDRRLQERSVRRSGNEQEQATGRGEQLNVHVPPPPPLPHPSSTVIVPYLQQQGPPSGVRALPPSPPSFASLPRSISLNLPSMAGQGHALQGLRAQVPLQGPVQYGPPLRLQAPEPLLGSDQQGAPLHLRDQAPILGSYQHQPPLRPREQESVQDIEKNDGRLAQRLPDQQDIEKNDGRFAL